MRPLSLAERGLGKPTVSRAALLRGTRAKIEGHTSLGLADYAHEIVASGFPGIRRLSGRALRAQLDGYIERIVDRDFEAQGHAVRRPQTLRRWMAAFAAATATTMSREKIRNAASAGAEEVPTKTTVIALPQCTRAVVESRSGSRLGMLGVDAGALLGGIATGAKLVTIAATDAPPRDGTLLGQMFEALVTQSVRVYAQAAEARVYDCRSYDGRREIDLIVETADQGLMALEVKTGAEVADSDVNHLLWLREQFGATLADMLIITTGKHAYRRQDGIAVVPAALLGP